jgi:hypothetical protein
MAVVDWSSLFDETYPKPGASVETLARFVRTIGEPLSGREVTAINRQQTNPFPADDPLHASFRRFDAAAWIIPNRSLPKSYLNFLSWSNGGEFCTGQRWFQFFPAIDSGHGVRAMLLAYCLPEYMPGSLPIAFNGGGTLYLFDMREPAIDGEYPVVCSHSGSLRWRADSHVRIADSFREACQGTVNVDDLRHR